MESQDEQCRLLRVEEVAKLVNCSRSKAYAMVAAGNIPSLRAGKSVRVPVIALKRWVEQNTTSASASEAAVAA